MSANPILESIEKTDFSGERRTPFFLPTENGHRVGATMHWPTPEAYAGNKNTKRILLLPGWSGPRSGPADLLVQLASACARDGHVVLRIDLHGRGDATGTFEDGDLDRMIADAGAGLDLLKQQTLPVLEAASSSESSRSPVPPLVVGGICSGGNVALGLASLRPSECAGVVALSVLPFQPSRGDELERRRRWKNIKQYASKALSPETWRKVFRGEVNLDRVKKNVSAKEKTEAGERNLKDSKRDIEQALVTWKGRALFVWGSADEESSLARAFFEGLHEQGCAEKEGAEFHEIAGANHNFYGKAWRAELTAYMNAFFQTF